MCGRAKGGGGVKVQADNAGGGAIDKADNEGRGAMVQADNAGGGVITQETKLEFTEEELEVKQFYYENLINNTTIENQTPFPSATSFVGDYWFQKK